MSAISLRTLLPSARMSPASRIAIASPIAGLPLTRNIGCGGSTKPRRTGGDVAQAEDAVAGHEIDRLDVALRVERAGDAQEHPLLFGLDYASRAHEVLRLQSGDDGRIVEARPASRSVENSMKICSSCAPSTSIFDTSGTCSRRERGVLDVIAQFAEREAVGGERVDDAERVAEVVVEERADDA